MNHASPEPTSPSVPPKVTASTVTTPKVTAPDQVARVEGATVDLGRQTRCGFGEVVYGEGKSAGLIQRIAQAQLQIGQSVLITRIDAGVAAEVAAVLPHTRYHAIARTMRIGVTSIEDEIDVAEEQHHVAVVTAGSTDMAVALEAVETLRWMNVPVRIFEDIGVAGPQRLAAAAPLLRQASALVVVAGMEGALPSVVGGHVSAPIFAVPTSVGYGANLGGITALLSMLTSCAAGVAVVNIDAGFKGGYLAGMVVSQLINASKS